MLLSLHAARSHQSACGNNVLASQGHVSGILVQLSTFRPAENSHTQNLAASGFCILKRHKVDLSPRLRRKIRSAGPCRAGAPLAQRDFTAKQMNRSCSQGSGRRGCKARICMLRTRTRKTHGPGWRLHPGTRPGRPPVCRLGARTPPGGSSPRRQSMSSSGSLPPSPGVHPRYTRILNPMCCTAVIRTQIPLHMPSKISAQNSQNEVVHPVGTVILLARHCLPVHFTKKYNNLGNCCDVKCAASA